MSNKENVVSFKRKARERSKSNITKVALHKQSIIFGQSCVSSYKKRTKSLFNASVISKERFIKPSFIDSKSKKIMKSTQRTSMLYKSLRDSNKGEKVRVKVDYLKSNLSEEEYSDEVITSAMPCQKLVVSRRLPKYKRIRNFHSLLDIKCPPQRVGVIGTKILKSHDNPKVKGNKVVLLSKKKDKRLKNWQVYQMSVLNRRSKSINKNKKKSLRNILYTRKMIIHINRPATVTGTNYVLLNYSSYFP